MARNKAKYTESEILAKLAAQGMVNKKALDVRILDLSEVESAPANFFVICSGNVPSHTSAICDGVHETIKKATGYNPHKVEGYNNAEWILMDYFDVVVHIFLKEKREHYRLEELWADGKITVVDSEPAEEPAPKRKTAAPKSSRSRTKSKED
ncbi:MAG: ribosome silencing factor [Bacteroidales bacterium]|nr:ribosome silencing factor [Bacteroidales bacterium]